MQSKNILDVKSFMYDKISCFADCGSECLIMRVPYDIAATMMKNMPESDAKDQLIERVRVASRRSKILKSALDEIFEKK